MSERVRSYLVREARTPREPVKDMRCTVPVQGSSPTAHEDVVFGVKVWSHRQPSTQIARSIGFKVTAAIFLSLATSYCDGLACKIKILNL